MREFLDLPLIEKYDVIPDVVAWIEGNYSEEFCLAEEFNTSFLSRLASEGFICMSIEIGGKWLLSPKLHTTRALLYPSDFRVRRPVRKAAKGLSVSVNAAFEEVVDSCAKVHGEDWLSPPLRWILEKLFWEKSLRPAKRSQETSERPYRAIPASVEVWRGDRLVAGEFGMQIGSIYTSYSGFYLESGAGSVQLACLAALLHKNEGSLWDLGMPLPYKDSMGCLQLSRSDFLATFRRAREGKRALHDIALAGKIDADDLLKAFHERRADRSTISPL